jgi:hypothetical protein
MDRRTEARIATGAKISAALQGNANTSRARVDATRRMVERYIKAAPRYLTRIEAIEKRLLTANHLSPEQIRRLEIVANINLKKLDKIIPDIRQLVVSESGVPTVREKEQLIAEAKQLGLDVEKLWADYGVSEGEVIEGELEEDSAAPDTEADEQAEAS